MTALSVKDPQNNTLMIVFLNFMIPSYILTLHLVHPFIKKKVTICLVMLVKVRLFNSNKSS